MGRPGGQGLWEFSGAVQHGLGMGQVVHGLRFGS